VQRDPNGRAMTPRRRTVRLICSGDLNTFALIMAFVVFLPLSVIMTFPAHSPHGTWPDAPRIHHPKVLGAWAWGGANRSDAVIVSVTRDSRIYFGADAVSSAQLPARIRERISSGSERRVYIQAHARARYDAVKSVLDAIQAAGVEDVSIFADESRDMPSASHVH
jgi:biopolymer transport protein ExbD